MMNDTNDAVQPVIGKWIAPHGYDDEEDKSVHFYYRTSDGLVLAQIDEDKFPYVPVWGSSQKLIDHGLGYIDIEGAKKVIEDYHLDELIKEAKWEALAKVHQWEPLTLKADVVDEDERISKKVKNGEVSNWYTIQSDLDWGYISKDSNK
jgi:hypothetical protein